MTTPPNNKIYIRKSIAKAELSKIQGQNNKTIKKLQLPVKTRWGSYYNMVNLIYENQNFLQQAIFAVVGKIVDGPEIKNILIDPDFWQSVKNMKEIFEPISRALISLERNIIDDPLEAYNSIDCAFDTSNIILECSTFDEMTKYNLSQV